MSRSLLVPIALAVCIGAGPWIVVAADSKRGTAAIEDPELVEYVEVNVSELPTSNTITTKLPLAMQHTPANVGVVSDTLFREQGAVTLNDALKNVSGLNIQSQSGIHDFFVIRGFDSLNGSMVLTDGAAEPEATFYPLYNVDAVEVLKGPAGFLYGSNPLAGTVNLVRKQPLRTQMLGFTGTTGSFDSYAGTVDWNLAPGDGDLALRLNAMWNESDHYRDDKQSEHLAVNPTFSWRASDRTTLNVGFEFVDAEYSPDSGLPIVNAQLADVPRRRSYQSPLDFSEQIMRRFQIDFETEISDRVTLRNKAYYRDLDWNSAGTLLTGVLPAGTPTLAGPLPSATVLRSFSVLDDRQRFVGNQFEALITAEGGSSRHNILAGLEVARNADEFEISALIPPNPFGLPSIPAIDLYNPVETFTAMTAPPALQQAGDARSVVIAPYLIDQIEFSERYQLLLGLRYDDIDFEDDRSSIARDDSEFSPMVGFVFSPDPEVSFYANGARSHAPPVTRVGDPTSPADREPERSTQFELGAKRRFANDRVRTTLALFQIERENIGIPSDGGFTLEIGDQRSRGVELEFAAELRSRLYTFVSYAYTDAELTRITEVERDNLGRPVTVDRSGNTPAFVPRHLINVWLSKTFSGGFGVAGGGRYFSDQYIANDNRFEIGSTAVLDAAVFYQAKRFKVQLNLKNLTDEEYETRGFSNFSVIPADSFSASLTVECRL